MMAHISPYVYPFCFQSHSEKKNLSTIFAITLLRDSRQILHLILGEFKGINDLYSPWNHQKTYGFLMISGGIEVNQFT